MFGETKIDVPWKVANAIEEYWKEKIKHEKIIFEIEKLKKIAECLNAIEGEKNSVNHLNLKSDKLNIKQKLSEILENMVVKDENL